MGLLDYLTAHLARRGLRRGGRSGASEQDRRRRPGCPGRRGCSWRSRSSGCWSPRPARRPRATADESAELALVADQAGERRQGPAGSPHAEPRALSARSPRCARSDLAATSQGRQVERQLTRLGVDSGQHRRGTRARRPGGRRRRARRQRPQQRSSDPDLQKLVNGLWQAGAEAISINGQRLTNLTAIRHAGRRHHRQLPPAAARRTPSRRSATRTRMPARFAGHHRGPGMV